MILTPPLVRLSRPPGRAQARRPVRLDIIRRIAAIVPSRARRVKS